MMYQQGVASGRRDRMRRGRDSPLDGHEVNGGRGSSVLYCVGATPLRRPP